MLTESLVRGAAKGDLEAARVLFQRAARVALARIRRSLSDRHACDDAMQDALLAAYRCLGDLREPRAFWPWFRTIVDRCVARQISVKAVEREQGELPGLADGAREPTETLASSEMLKTVREAIRHLPPRNRIAVELFYFDGLSCREVAGFLGTSVGVVKTRLSRSRRILKRRMETLDTAAEEDLTIKHSWVSGRSRRPGPPFPHESPITRFYMKLYPRGHAGKAGKRAGLSEKEREESVRFLESRRFIVREGDEWRCLLPVATERDAELIKPWVDTVAAPYTQHLEEIYAGAAAITEQAGPEEARQTILTAALWGHAVRAPKRPIEKAMGLAEPDRGADGSYFAAARTFPGEHPFLTGHIETSLEISDDHGHCFYYFHPACTDRSALDGVFQLLDPSAGIPSDWSKKLFLSLHRRPVAKGDRVSRAAELNVRASSEEGFWQAVIGARGAEVHGGALRCAIPVVPLEVWQPFIATVQRFAHVIEENVVRYSDDLRRRAELCTFANCNFPDGAAVFLWSLEDAIAAEIYDRGWLRFPEKADFSWGVLLAIGP